MFGGWRRVVMDILENDLSGALTFVHLHLLRHKISTHQHHDFVRFRKRKKKLSGIKPSGQFDVKRLSLHKQNAFWLEWRHKKKAIAIHALRFEDYGDQLLADIWSAGQQELIYGGGKTGTNHSPLANKMSGKIVYGGDFFIHRKYRGIEGLSTSLAIQSFIYAEIKWKPDWIYGFIDKGNITERGFAQRFTYQHSSPLGTDWKAPPKGINADDYLVAMEREELSWNVRAIARLGLAGLLRMQS